MRLNVQEELQRFKAWQDGAPPAAGDPDLLQLLGVITAYLQTLNTGDHQVVRVLRKIGPHLATELNRLMPQSASSQAVEQPSANKDNVLFAIYDRIESQLIVAKANRNRVKMEIYQQLFDFLQAIFAQELQWFRMESLGKIYNPYEYDGFAMKSSLGDRNEKLPGLVIVNELRAGFTCRGKVIRKPVVEFLE